MPIQRIRPPTTPAVILCLFSIFMSLLCFVPLPVFILFLFPYLYVHPFCLFFFNFFLMFIYFFYCFKFTSKLVSIQWNNDFRSRFLNAPYPFSLSPLPQPLQQPSLFSIFRSLLGFISLFLYYFCFPSLMFICFVS